ncbi:MAG: phosphoenolpyruvate carboxykinase (ATP) [Bdellovibrionota bacterium]
MSKTVTDYGFQHSPESIFENASQETLLKHAVEYTGAKLTNAGAIVVNTGKHTGRAAKDKYVVFTPKTENTIDWKNNVNKMTPETFAAVKKDVVNHINAQPRLYRTTRNVGALPQYALQVQLFSTHPSHSLFFDYLMRNDNHSQCELGSYTIFHAPTLNIDAGKHGTRSKL